MKKYKQHFLVSEDNQNLITWLEADKCKEGDIITLRDHEDPNKMWTVDKVYNTVVTEKDISHGGHRSDDWYKNDHLRKFGNKK